MSELADLSQGETIARLLSLIRGYGSCLVALSAGVDSAVTAKAAHLALGEQAMAVTANSPSLAAGELTLACQLAEQIGIRHEVIDSQELAREAYRRNAPDRCYHCKTELYEQLALLAERRGIAVLVSGVNHDDLDDFRPGLAAARHYEVRAPLADCGLTKADVRELAATWGLSVWNKPATPCLASRIAYGEEVTPQRLAMVDQAEQLLRSWGLPIVRVRYHAGDVASIEVPAQSLALLCEPARRGQLTLRLRELGFKFITLDLEGFRSGSLNELVPLEILRKPT